MFRRTILGICCVQVDSAVAAAVIRQDIELNVRPQGRLVYALEPTRFRFVSQPRQGLLD